MSVIDGKSHTGLKFFREKPAALAVYWVYCSRVNYENVAWPGERGLKLTTGWSVDSVLDARHWLVEHKALEIVEGYVRPEWRNLEADARSRLVNLDRSHYYRPTGYVEVKGKRYTMLYFAGAESASVDEAMPDGRRGRSSTPPIIDRVDQNLVPVLSQLNTTGIESSVLSESLTTPSDSRSFAASERRTDEGAISVSINGKSSVGYAAPGLFAVEENRSPSGRVTTAQTPPVPPPPPPKARALNPMFEAVAAAWAIDRAKTGEIIIIKALLEGRAKSGDWAASNLLPAATADEVLRFKTWYVKNYPSNDMPTIPWKIQRHFVDFRSGKVVAAPKAIDRRTGKPEKSGDMPFYVEPEIEEDHLTQEQLKYRKEANHLMRRQPELSFEQAVDIAKANDTHGAG